MTYEIVCKTHSVEINYLEKPACDYTVEAYLTIKKILKNKPLEERKDILVFLPGEEDINELFHMVKKIPCVSVCKIYSSMGDEEQKRIFTPSSLIKVIISTNICETSITIPNVKYVIDPGLCKVKYFDTINYFGIHSINRNSETQRLGRCNRIGPGICYRLYTEFQQLSLNTPDCLRSDTTTALLQIINLNQNVFTFEFLDYSPMKNVISSIFYLLDKDIISIFKNEKKLNKMSSENYAIYNIYDLYRQISFRISEYGKQLVFYPFDVQLAHFYQQCINNDVSYYGSLLLSLISQENFTFLTSQKHINKQSDIFHLINIMEKYLTTDNKSNFCALYILPRKSMDIGEKIFKSLNKSWRGEKNIFERIFSKSFCNNLCIRSKTSNYIMQQNGIEIHIHPTSGFFKRNDRKIVVVDVFNNIKPYAKIVGKYFD